MGVRQRLAERILRPWKVRERDKSFWFSLGLCPSSQANLQCDLEQMVSSLSLSDHICKPREDQAFQGRFQLLHPPTPLLENGGCGTPRQKPTHSWALTKSPGLGQVPAPSRFWKVCAAEGRGFSTPQPITKGPGRRGGASASCGGGQAGSEHPAAPDPPARTWRPSGPPRVARYCFSWPWQGSRRWQGAWTRAVRVSNCWSGGSERPPQRSKMARGRGRGCRRPPDPAQVR